MPFGSGGFGGTGRRRRRGQNLDPRIQMAQQLASVMRSQAPAKAKKTATEISKQEVSPSGLEKWLFFLQAVPKNVIVDPIEQFGKVGFSNKKLREHNMDEMSAADRLGAVLKGFGELAKSPIDYGLDVAKIYGTIGSGPERKELATKTMSKVAREMTGLSVGGEEGELLGTKHGEGWESTINVPFTDWKIPVSTASLMDLGVDIFTDPLTVVGGSEGKLGVRAAFGGVGKLAAASDDVAEIALRSKNVVEHGTKLATSAEKAGRLHEFEYLVDPRVSGMSFEDFVGAVPVEINPERLPIAAVKALETAKLPRGAKLWMRLKGVAQESALHAEEVNKYVNWVNRLTPEAWAASAHPHFLSKALAHSTERITLSRGFAEDMIKRATLGMDALDPHEIELATAGSDYGLSSRKLKALREQVKNEGVTLSDGTHIPKELTNLKDEFKNIMYSPTSKSHLADFGALLRYKLQLPGGAWATRALESRLAARSGEDAFKVMRLSNRAASYPKKALGKVVGDQLAERLTSLYDSNFAGSVGKAAGLFSTEKLPARAEARGTWARGGLGGATHVGQIDRKIADAAEYGEATLRRGYKQVALSRRDQQRIIRNSYQALQSRQNKVAQSLFRAVRSTFDDLGPEAEANAFDAAETGRSLERGLFPELNDAQFAFANEAVKTFSKMNRATSGLAAKLGAPEIIEHYFSHMRTGAGIELDKALHRLGAEGVRAQLANVAGDVAVSRAVSPTGRLTNSRTMLATARAVNEKMREIVLGHAQEMAAAGDTKLMDWLNAHPDWNYFSTNPAVVASAHMFAMQRAQFLAQMSEEARRVADLMGIDLKNTVPVGKDLRRVNMPQGVARIIQGEPTPEIKAAAGEDITTADMGPTQAAIEGHSRSIAYGDPVGGGSKPGQKTVEQVLPRMFANTIEEINQASIRPSDPLRWYGRIMSLWKKFALVGGGPLSTGFHFRNAISNSWNMFMAGMRNPKDVVDAVIMRKALNRAIGNLKANPYKYLQENPMDAMMAAVSEEAAKMPDKFLAESLEEAVMHGVVGVDRGLARLRGDLAQETQSQSMEGLERVYRKKNKGLYGARDRALEFAAGEKVGEVAGPVRGRAAGLMSFGLHPLDASLAVGSGIEDTSRLALFLHSKKVDGLQAADAAMHAKAIMIDYDDLTPFEQKWLRQRNVLPFYAWFRREASLVMTLMMTNPGTFQKYRLLSSGAWQAYDADPDSSEWTPQYYRESGIPIPPNVLEFLGDTPVVNWFFNPSTEFVDLGAIPPFALADQLALPERESLKEKSIAALGKNLNPFLNWGLAELTETIPFSGAPLRDTNKLEIPTPFQGVGQRIPGEPPFFVRDKDGKLWQTTEGRFTMEALFPPARLFRNVPAFAATPDEALKAEANFPSLFGINTEGLTEDTEKAEAYRRIEDLKALVAQLKMRGWDIGGQRGGQSTFGSGGRGRPSRSRTRSSR